MVELVLISVGIIAVAMFFMSIRSMRAGNADADPRLLDGSPHWVAGTVVSVVPDGTYLGLSTVKLTLRLGENEHEAGGPLPRRFEAEIRAGLTVEGHVEYDILDTLRTQLWDSSAEAVLRACAAELQVDASPARGAPTELKFVSKKRAVSVLLAEDGWVTIVVDSAVTEDVYVDLRTDFDAAETAFMLTERLGATQDDAEDAGEFLQRLAPDTLDRLEAFAVRLGGWICIDEGFEFECALPFPEGSLVATIVSEALDIAELIERDHEAMPSDGVW